MNSRERAIAAIEHREGDRVPLDGYFRPEIWAELERHFGTHDRDIIRKALGIDIYGVFGSTVLQPNADFRTEAVPASIVGVEVGSPRYTPSVGSGPDNLVRAHDNGWLEDEWGVCRVVGATGKYWHYTHHPLAETDDVAGFRFPNPSDPERYEYLRQTVQSHKADYLVMVEMPTIFKHGWELRGFDRFMMDLHHNRRFVEELSDRLLAHKIEEGRNLVASGVDIVGLFGDIAMQDMMMISPDMWRQIFKPRLKLLLEEIRKHGEVYFLFHSDGNIEPVIEDLIEIGFDIVNPIQPESMDPTAIKKRYGDKITLHGTIGCQHTLPYGTVEEVRDEVKRRLEYCAVGGGLIIAPSNIVEFDVPLQNLLAVYETVREHKYR